MARFSSWWARTDSAPSTRGPSRLTQLGLSDSSSVRTPPESILGPYRCTTLPTRGGLHGQDRAAGAAQHFLGDAPHQHPVQSRPAVRPDHDQVAPVVVRRAKDLL